MVLWIDELSHIIAYSFSLLIVVEVFKLNQSIEKIFIKIKTFLK